MDESSTRYRAETADQAGTRQAGMGVLLTLAVAGLAVFGGALYWFFNAWGGAESSIIGRLAVWIACFSGVACFSLAAYLMLERLARAAGDLGDE